MLESYEIENKEQLRAIAAMLRIRIFEMLQQKPMTVTQLGEELVKLLRRYIIMFASLRK